MAQCSGKHISEMQLFHELKQRFPNIPDRLVAHCIKQTRGDKAACACILEAETLLTSYRMASRPTSLSLEESGGCLAAWRGGNDNGGCTTSCCCSHSAPATPSPARRPSAPARPLSPSPNNCPLGFPLEKPRRPPTVRSTSMPDVKPIDRSTHLLLQDQLARKKKLEIELEKEKEKLGDMKRAAEEMERDLNARLQGQSYASKAQRLREEIAGLRTECIRLSAEVDQRSQGEPFSEMNDEYYKNITGTSGLCQQNSSSHRERHRGDPSTASGNGGGGGLVVAGGEVASSVDGSVGSHWCCDMCTFRNHPLLPNCEGCEMPRIVSDVGETQNIHIHVTHHNFPSCKVVHSWVI